MNILSNSILNILQKISLILFSIITLPYLTNTLSVESYGQMNLILAFFYFFASFSVIIHSYAVTELSRLESEEFNKKFIVIYFLQIIIFFIPLVICLISIFLYHKLNIDLGILIVGLIYLFVTTLGPEWYLQSLIRFKYIAIRTILIRAISLFLIFFFVKNDSDWIICLYILMLMNMVPSLLTIFIIFNGYFNKKYIFLLLNAISDKALKKEFLSSISSIVSSTLTTFLLNGFFIVISVHLSTTEIGLYSFIDKINKIVIVLTSAVTAVFLPFLSKIVSDTSFFKNINNKYLYLLSAGLVVIYSAISQYGGYIFSFYFEGKYQEINDYVLLAFLPLVLNPISSFFIFNIFYPMGWYKKHLLVCFTTTIFVLPLSLFITKEYNLYGAIISMLISELITLMLLLYLIVKNRVEITLFPLLYIILMIFLNFLISNAINEIYLKVIIVSFSFLMLLFSVFNFRLKIRCL